MGLITVIIVLIVVGVILQLVKEYVEPKLYLTAIIIIILVVALLILNALGIGPRIHT